LPSDRIVEGDIHDDAAVQQAVEGTDIVVHMAAMMGVKRTLDQPLSVLETNLDGTRAVLESAADSTVERVLIASTSEVYGDAPDPPYAETDPTAPKTNYAVAKLAAERFTTAYAETTDLSCTVVRYFNVYGPRQDSSQYGYVVPIFVRSARDGEAIEVHGDGSQTRDFTYIDDAVDCTVAALGPEGRDEVFNVGTGRETSIRTLATTVRDAVDGTSIEYVDHPRPYTIERRCANIDKARRKLSYEPRHSIKQGVKKLAESGVV
jgi:UDP-glucose 4-epimerase